MSESLVHNLLDGYQYATLLRIADFHGLRMPGQESRPSKQVLIVFLEKQLSAADHGARALAHLTHLERTVLDRLLLSGGDTDTEILRDTLQHEGIVHPATQTDLHTPYEADPLNREGYAFEDVISRLTLQGLVLSSSPPPSWAQKKIGFAPGLRLTIPEPVRSQLPRPMPPSVEWGRGALPAPTDETSPELAQRELYVYWSTVRDEPLALTHSGLLQKRALRSIHQELLSMSPSMGGVISESSSPRFYFLRLVLQELGLLVRRGRQVCASDRSNEIPMFWEQPLEQRARSSLHAWLTMKRWSELASLRLSSLHLDLPRARRLLLEQLGLLSPEVWISSERFLNRLAVIVPSMIFQPRDNARPGDAQSEDGFDRQSLRLAEIEGAFVGAALSGPLHWLGVVDVAVDGDRLFAFRLNSGGAGVLGTHTEIPAAGAETGKVIIQPNFQILALGPVSTAILAKLEMFAERTKVDRRAFQYALTRESIYRGEKNGLAADDVVAFLTAHCSVPIPHNVVRTVQEWGEQHERIIFHREVSLCQSETAESLRYLLDHPAIHPHLERQLTPTVAIVRRRHTHALQERLLQQDVLPAFSPKGSGCAGRVLAAPDGELQRLHAGPDLLLASCLRHLTEERESRFYVTQQAVTRALGTGMTIVQYLEELSRIHHGPLPATLQAQVKAWGHYYGLAKLEQATLLELKDATTASELLADEELAPWLSRFPEDPQGRTLLVRADDLETLRRLLCKRGVDLT